MTPRRPIRPYNEKIKTKIYKYTKYKNIQHTCLPGNPDRPGGPTIPGGPGLPSVPYNKDRFNHLKTMIWVI